MGSALQPASILLTVCLHRDSAGVRSYRRRTHLLYSFSDFTLDTDRRELRQGAETISVTPQVFDILNYLIRNRERVVSKDELIAGVWKGRIVSDAALTTRLNAARSSIGDTGETQHLIKTLPRKGFRFVGAVQEAPRPATETVGTVERTGDTLPRLSIVVLPFANLSSDREQDYFVDGVTESLTTDLSRDRWLICDRTEQRRLIQGYSSRCTASRPRIERSLRARRLSATQRQAAPGQRAVARCQERPASLGRAL